MMFAHVFPRVSNVLPHVSTELALSGSLGRVFLIDAPYEEDSKLIESSGAVLLFMIFAHVFPQVSKALPNVSTEVTPSGSLGRVLLIDGPL